MQPFAVISADRLGLSEAELFVRRMRLEESLGRHANDAYPVLGFFQGVHEVSFVAQGITRADAVGLGHMYDQDSVLFVSADGATELVRCDDGTGSMIGTWTDRGEVNPHHQGGWTKIGDTYFTVE